MLRQIMNTVSMIVILTVICGFIYPLMMTGAAQVVFPFQANGSVVTRHNEPIGSQLIGQNFSGTGYFHGRPSLAGEKGYDAGSSGGSNLGPTSKKLIDAVSANLKQVRDDNSLGESTRIPSDLVWPREADLIRILRLLPLIFKWNEWQKNAIWHLESFIAWWLSARENVSGFCWENRE